MKSVHIRNLKPSVLEALKRRARAHQRSLQGELVSILENAARAAPPAEERAPLELITVRVGGDSTFGRDEIYGDDGR